VKLLRPTQHNHTTKSDTTLHRSTQLLPPYHRLYFIVILSHRHTGHQM